MSTTSAVRRLGAILGVLLIALVANLSRVQYLGAAHISSQPSNTRRLIASYTVDRGPILVAGAPVAASVATSGLLKYQRVYLAGPMYAAVTGFLSRVYGATGIEAAEDPVLAGTDPRIVAPSGLADLVAGQTRKGGSVVLTLDPAAQKAAYDTMGAKVGAVVAIQPSTGAILALVQSPSFDPNQLANNDANVQIAAWARLTASPVQPLLNRAIRQVYPPGSTFKLVTATAALSSGRYTPTTVVPGPAELLLPGTTTYLPNDTGGACYGGSLTLTQALAVSCNTAFAHVGLDLGAAALTRQADLFGFNRAFTIPLAVVPSRFPADINVPQTALSAIGQYDVRATPLQMAMVASAIANHGTLMTPYLVSQLRAPDTSVLAQASPRVASQAMTPQVAQEMTAMMVAVVAYGTGTPAQIPGVVVAGKTGTAQTAPGQSPDAWFVAFAPAADPKVAVAVAVEGAPSLGDITGGRLAAPVAKAVIQAVLSG